MTQMEGISALPPISEVFSDPYSPDKSFWVHSEIETNLKDCFIAADRYLAEGNLRLAKRPIEAIAEKLPVGVRDQYARRLTYNYYYLRPMAPQTRKLDLPADLRAEYVHQYSENRAVVDNIAVPGAVNHLVQRTRAETRRLYGADLVRSHIHVRYANANTPSPYKCDDTQDVASQLLSVMHFDEKKGITSIVYLTDVGERNGCFSYLKGSHLLKQSLSIRAFHETISDDLRLKTVDDARRHGIPAELFGTLAYGENLPAHKRDVAKRYVTKLVGEAGTAISFTGNTLVHGGGWPLEGERIAMFVDHVGLVSQRAKYLIPYFMHFRLSA